MNLISLFRPSKSRKEGKSSSTEAFPVEYHFTVVDTDNDFMRIIITKNDIPYCQYDSTGEFFNPNHIGLKDMSVDEKSKLWHFINQHGENVDGITFCSD